jgi:hypothetical protein
VDIILKPTPFGANQPPIPVARAITVARVSSPTSTDRSYQSSFLHSLHKYFLEERRLVKQGDIIGVPLNTDDARWSWLFGESGEETQSNGVDTAAIACVQHRRSLMSLTSLLLRTLGI